jgi:glutamyl-tRNA synthetase
MDYAKLSHLNAQYLRAKDPDEITGDVLAILRGRGALPEGAVTTVRALMPDIMPRARTLIEAADMCGFAIATIPLTFEPKAAAQLTPEAKLRLSDLAEFLEDAPWERADLDKWLRDYAEVKGLKLGMVAQPLRAALTGSTQSPPIDIVLFALGRGEALARIRAAAR